MGKCPKHPSVDLYTPSVRRVGRKDFSLPFGWCFACFEENDRRPEYAMYFPRTLLDLTGQGHDVRIAHLRLPRRLDDG